MAEKKGQNLDAPWNDFYYLFGLREMIRKRRNGKTYRPGRGVLDNYVGTFIELKQTIKALTDLLAHKELDYCHKDFYTLQDPEKMLDHLLDIEIKYYDAEHEYEKNHVCRLEIASFFNDRHTYHITEFIKLNEKKIFQDLEMVRKALYKLHYQN